MAQAEENSLTTEAIEAGLSPEELGFDPDQLRERYRHERDVRLRDDGITQYRAIEGEFSRYLDDPYIKVAGERAPLTDEVEVAVLGGGFGGLLVAANLRKAGVQNLRVIEMGGDFGGTWYWNRYPGAACDIESYIYLPLLEELGYMPREKYSKAPEILEYSKSIARHFDLYRDVCFHTQVTELRWDEAISRWIVHTNRGDAIRAHYVCMAHGLLNRPKLPGIPGVETFKGHSFHTSRWDYEYTGGDSNGNLTGLADKRVGIIGTGATAVQCVPHLGASAKQLYVFQRTPSSVDARGNSPTDTEWFKSLPPGWQDRRMENFNILVNGGTQEEDMVSDGWTDLIRHMLKIAARAPRGSKNRRVLLQLADFSKMEQIRNRIGAIVEDKATAEALKPWYNQFCKRPCFHDDYHATFNRPNVTLVDTHGRGVERITENAVVVDGKAYEIDCLIYATGFEVGTAYTHRSGYELYGRGGLALSEKWREGVATLHGVISRGFPNCFVIGNSQMPFTPNFPHAISLQARNIAYIIKYGIDHDLKMVEPSQEAEDAWVQTIVSLAVRRMSFLEECTPSYQNNEGRPSLRSASNSPYAPGAAAFAKLLEEWRATGRLEGLELTPNATA
jgi:cation diffusion facilitator CzcD-associated flavoprotein CzcO